MSRQDVRCPIHLINKKNIENKKIGFLNPSFFQTSASSSCSHAQAPFLPLPCLTNPSSSHSSTPSLPSTASLLAFAAAPDSADMPRLLAVTLPASINRHYLHPASLPWSPPQPPPPIFYCLPNTVAEILLVSSRFSFVGRCHGHHRIVAILPSSGSPTTEASFAMAITFIPPSGTLKHCCYCRASFFIIGRRVLPNHPSEARCHHPLLPASLTSSAPSMTQAPASAHRTFIFVCISSGSSPSLTLSPPPSQVPPRLISIDWLHPPLPPDSSPSRSAAPHPSTPKASSTLSRPCRMPMTSLTYLHLVVDVKASSSHRLLTNRDGCYMEEREISPTLCPRTWHVKKMGGFSHDLTILHLSHIEACIPVHR